MTRLIYDQFSKDYLEELLSPYGEVKAPQRVASEVREIDLYFRPLPNLELAMVRPLGILGRMAASPNPSIFEPFRNPVSEDEICDCLGKLLDVRRSLQRQANRNNRRLSNEALPKLWILTPTASPTILSRFSAMLEENWLPGIYGMGEAFRSAIVVIHQLPQTPETLWLRLLGRGRVQEQAIDELEALSPDIPLRSMTLNLLYHLERTLAVRQDLDEGDRALIMRLAPLYQQEQEKAFQQGERQGERRVIEGILRSRFGSIDEELAAIIELVMELPPEEFAPLLWQLEREELLQWFNS